ncbi:MAG: hypothetical protein NDF54_07085 [archaeon GB-1867-035]|nr:hypothetical protein [Candidatus Culexmicrobium profundum]
MNNIIRFARATVYARKIMLEKYLVRLTSGHRGRVARVYNGYIIIEKRWYPKQK